MWVIPLIGFWATSHINTSAATRDTMNSQSKRTIYSFPLSNAWFYDSSLFAGEKVIWLKTTWVQYCWIEKWVGKKNCNFFSRKHWSTMRKPQNDLWWAAILLSYFHQPTQYYQPMFKVNGEILLKTLWWMQHLSHVTGALPLTRLQHRIFKWNLDRNGHNRQAVFFCHDCSMTISIQVTSLMAATSSFFLIKDPTSGLHSCSQRGILLRSRVALKMWTSFCSGRLVCVTILAAAILVSSSEGKTHSTICVTDMWLLRADMFDLSWT